MYRVRKQPKTSLKVNNVTEGEFIEAKMRRIMQNKEPIKDGAPLLYTERKDGVLAGTNIRTDVWEIANEKMDAVNKAKVAKRKGDKPATIGEEAKEGMTKEQAGGETKGGESKA